MNIHKARTTTISAVTNSATNPLPEKYDVPVKDFIVLDKMC